MCRHHHPSKKPINCETSETWMCWVAFLCSTKFREWLLPTFRNSCTRRRRRRRHSSVGLTWEYLEQALHKRFVPGCFLIVVPLPRSVFLEGEPDECCNMCVGLGRTYSQHESKGVFVCGMHPEKVSQSMLCQMVAFLPF